MVTDKQVQDALDAVTEKKDLLVSEMDSLGFHTDDNHMDIEILAAQITLLEDTYVDIKTILTTE